MSRIAIFVYGVLCYALCLVAFVYGIGFIGGFLTPTMLDGPAQRPLGVALTVNVALLVAFALQHSIMARPAFKRWWTGIIPEAAERSTYVLASSIAVGGLFAFWEPVGGVVWQTEGALRTTVTGVKQVWRRLTGKEYQPPQFYTPSLYKLVRHPLYIGWLTIFWAAPTMTVSHLVFALVTTAYILFAIRLEERDLVDVFGADYVAYRARTPMLVPRLPASGGTDAAANSRART